MVLWWDGAVMTNPEIPAAPSAVPHVMDEQQAAALARLLAQYADDLPEVERRHPQTLIPAAGQAVASFHALIILRHMSPSRPAPQPRPDDVLDALRLIPAARADLDSLEGVLLHIARNAGTNVGDKDKPLLTFRQISAALGLASEQAAQGRYQRRVGNLNMSDSGLDGAP
jgi:hypothetical protein